MPEMPGVMTDILISMDDRLTLIGSGKKMVAVGQNQLGLVHIGTLDLVNFYWDWSEGIF